MTQTTTTGTALAIGEVLSAKAGQYIVRAQRVRIDAFVVTVEHAASGFQANELRQSFRHEADARDVARAMTVCLRNGLTVDQTRAAALEENFALLTRGAQSEAIRRQIAGNVARLEPPAQPQAMEDLAASIRRTIAAANPQAPTYRPAWKED